MQAVNIWCACRSLLQALVPASACHSFRASNPPARVTILHLSLGLNSGLWELVSVLRYIHLVTFHLVISALILVSTLGLPLLSYWTWTRLFSAIFIRRDQGIQRVLGPYFDFTRTYGPRELITMLSNCQNPMTFTRALTLLASCSLTVQLSQKSCSLVVWVGQRTQ